MHGERIDVLDHGFVRLVDHMGNDLSIVRAARVSYDAAWRAGENDGSDHRLIQFLWKNHHTTPFEAVEFQFEVKAPIFVIRQWHRHRTWTFNELSGRYRELDELYYVPDPKHIGSQSLDNKQGRVIDESEHAGLALRLDDTSRLRSHHAKSFEIYRDLIADGWPRELARSVLPVATYSHMFAKVDLHNLFHFLSLRCHSHAQYEIRVYADAMLRLIEPIVPVAVGAWRKEFEAAHA